jgi:hypothetical protein
MCFEGDFWGVAVIVGTDWEAQDDPRDGLSGGSKGNPRR